LKKVFSPELGGEPFLLSARCEKECNQEFFTAGISYGMFRSPGYP
jgi:hypothetical protein